MASSVARACGILQLLSKKDRLSLSGIATELEIPKSTAHSILKDLVDTGFVETEGSRFRIGLAAFETGSARLRGDSVHTLLTEQLAQLTRDLNMTSHYAVLDGEDVIYLYKEDVPAIGVRLASSVGVRLPAARTAVGKACLAWSPEPVRRATGEGATGSAKIKRGSSSGGSDLDAELATVRQRGYALDDGRTAVGIVCVAAPVFAGNGLHGALGVSYLPDGAPTQLDIAQRVMQGANRLTATMGGQKAS